MFSRMPFPLLIVSLLSTGGIIRAQPRTYTQTPEVAPSVTAGEAAATSEAFQKNPDWYLSGPPAHWIWGADPNGKYVLRKTFTTRRTIGWLVATCDNSMTVFLNGKQVASSDAWESPVEVDVSRHLKSGENVLTAEVANAGGISGFLLKMTLTDPGRLAVRDTRQVFPLTTADLAELQALYTVAYPGNWFNPRMLETGQYVGLRDADGALVCAAGVHVYSAEYRVAALGNIATHPGHRGRGLAAITTAGCCQRLLQTVDLIGLNVRADNAAAIRAYEKIGFEVRAVYHEWMMEPKSATAAFPE